MGAHYEAAIRSGRIKRPKPPDLPDAARHAWGVFTRLHRARPVGMVAGAIPWSEIEAFGRVTGERLARWEVEIITTLDEAFLASIAST